MRFAPVLPLVLLIAGCAGYQHEIRQPAGHATLVTPREEVAVLREPLQYRLRTVDGRLLMRIYNPLDEPVTLRGDLSTVVDPSGQSNPLRTRTIAPESEIRLLLPPQPPRAVATRGGPTVGFGLGSGVGLGGGTGAGVGVGTTIGGPRRVAIETDDPIYWEWPGTGEVRLDLVFEGPEERFEHEWVLGRIRR